MKEAEFSLRDFSSRLFLWIESFSRSPLWRLKLCILLSLIAVFLHFPRFDYVARTINPEFAQSQPEKYSYLEKAFGWSHWPEIERKIASPFAPSNERAGSHEAKLVLRLTVPLLAKALGLKSFGIFIFQTILAFLSIYLVLKISEKLTSDPVTAVLFLASCIPLHFMQTGIFQFSAKLDSFAYFFLLLAMVSNLSIGIGLSIFLACWTDERAILASVLVFCFWLSTESNHNRDKLKEIVKGNKQSWAVVLSLCLFVLSRLLIQYFTGLKTPIGEGSGVEFTTILRSMSLMWTGVWSIFRGSWFVVLLSVVFLLRKNYLMLLMVFIASLPLLLGSFFVYDITRTGSYLFPILFVSFAIVVRAVPVVEARLVLLGMIVANLLSSPLNIVSGEAGGHWRLGIHYVADQPLPMQILDYLYFFVL